MNNRIVFVGLCVAWLLSTSLAAAQQPVEIVNQEVDVEHGAPVDPGPPSVLIGCRVSTAQVTGEADDDKVDVRCDEHGNLLVAGSPRAGRVPNRVALTTTTETTLIAAGATGIFRDISYLSCNNESATEVRVDIRDATAGTVRFSFDLAADGGGFVSPFPDPWPQTTAANNWTAQLSGAVSTVYCHALAIEDK